MSNNQRLTNEELTQISERVKVANGYGPISERLIREDIPKLIAEVEYRREKQAELLEYNRQYFAEIKRLRETVEDQQRTIDWQNDEIARRI